MCMWAATERSRLGWEATTVRLSEEGGWQTSSPSFSACGLRPVSSTSVSDPINAPAPVVLFRGDVEAELLLERAL
jgi:hypothetical protein